MFEDCYIPVTPFTLNITLGLVFFDKCTAPFKMVSAAYIRRFELQNTRVAGRPKRVDCYS